MAPAENDELARIALEEGFCTQAQIERCLQIQRRTDERLSLGQSLLREGYITQEQYSRALVLLRQGYKKERDAAVVLKTEQRIAEGRAKQSQEDRVLGGIVVAEGLIGAELLKVCLDAAARSGRSLGETLVVLGHLDAARVESIVNRFERKDLTCPSCKATLSIVRLPTPDPVRCPRCRSVVR